MPNAGVQVAGMLAGKGGGLKESQVAFRKHFTEMGHALLNISGVGTIDGEPVDKDEDRLPYDPRANQWPKAAYHADGRFEVAVTATDMEELVSRGFRKEPYPKIQIAIGDPQAEKKELQRQLAEKTGQIAALTEAVQKKDEVLSDIMRRMEALEGARKK